MIDMLVALRHSSLEPAMEVNVRCIAGNWDTGYVLDKHVLSSIDFGDNEFGHPQFDTTRSEFGQALYQTKYRQNWSRVPPLPVTIATPVVPRAGKVELVAPMP